MGTLYSTQKTSETQKRIWPVRNFNNVEEGTDLEELRFGMWDPRKYRDIFRYPNKEPAKDF